jgi:hypothetical protein
VVQCPGVICCVCLRVVCEAFLTLCVPCDAGARANGKKEQRDVLTFAPYHFTLSASLVNSSTASTKSSLRDASAIEAALRCTSPCNSLCACVIAFNSSRADANCARNNWRSLLQSSSTMLMDVGGCNCRLDAGDLTFRGDGDLFAGLSTLEQRQRTTQLKQVPTDSDEVIVSIPAATCRFPWTLVSAFQEPVDRNHRIVSTIMTQFREIYHFHSQICSRIGRCSSIESCGILRHQLISRASLSLRSRV